MPTLIYDAENRPIRESRNLRGLLDHARRVAPTGVECAPPDSLGWSTIYVYFANGDSAATQWADWRVAAQWFASRRSWPTLAVRETLRVNLEFGALYRKLRPQ